MTAPLAALVEAIDAALDDPSHADDAARVDAFRSALEALLADPEPLPAWAYEPYEGRVIGNLVHRDPAGRYHIMVVVFPEGGSTGIHQHGGWAISGSLTGGDEDTRYAPVEREIDDEGIDLAETARVLHEPGEIEVYLGPDGGWHRLRNRSTGSTVSVHVLCLSPEAHPHRYWRRDDGRTFAYPFEEVSPGRWTARVAFDVDSGLGLAMPPDLGG